jgi:hypothetical protein
MEMGMSYMQDGRIRSRREAPIHSLLDLRQHRAERRVPTSVEIEQ